ncbi:MAG TPA: DUF2339 domain-containing protein, partial [Candidatus Methylomirabilis sp.]|nr:DUF2339 domain-containing protein [Candidatus Methylomirabilis sp.]
MESLWLLVILGVVVWLARGLWRANQRIDKLEGRIADLLVDLGLVEVGGQTGRRSAGESPSASDVHEMASFPPSRTEDGGAGQIRAPVEVSPPPADTFATPRPLPSAAQSSVVESASGAQTPGADTTTVPPLPPRFARPAMIPPIDWEQFMGVKLFAWLGGLGLFLGVGFFVKYSFEHELIPPEVRVVLGFLAGLALLVAGLRMAGQRYDVTAQTLCATGVVILYAVTFACRSVYHFPLFGLIPTFLLMTLITATAFLLAVRLDTQVVAILGMLAGFLT